MLRKMILLSLVLATGCARAVKEPTSSFEPSTYFQVVCQDDTAQLDILSIVYLQGDRTLPAEILTLPTSLETLTQYFGEPSQTLDLGWGLYVWDDLGIFSHQGESGQVRTIYFDFRYQGFEYSPTDPFTGMLQVGDQILDEKSTDREFRNAGLFPVSGIPEAYTSLTEHLVVLTFNHQISTGELRSLGLSCSDSPHSSE